MPFKTPMVCQKLTGRRFQLTTPLVYVTHDDTTLVVPAGFVTDLASIPRAFYISTPPIGDYDLPAVLHDWLYSEQFTSREAADAIFKDAMQDCGVGWYTRTKMFWAVRLFGRAIWASYAADTDEAA